MGGVGVVALGALIGGDAEQGGADGPPGPFGQGHGGEGVAVPGGHRFGSVESIVAGPGVSRGR